MALRVGPKPTPKYDPRALYLRAYLQPHKLPMLAASTNWRSKVTVPWGMDGNDELGDCGCAGGVHLVMNVSANGAGLIAPAKQDAIAMYEALGYNPNAPLDANGQNPTDQGILLADGLKYMRAVGIAGQKADAWADIHVADVQTQKYGIQLFGGLYRGVQLPQSAIDAFEAGQREWTDLSEPPDPENGHCVVDVDYDTGGVYLATWCSDTVPGADDVVFASWPWVLKYSDEVHAVLFFDWLNRQGVSPGALNQPQLEADLSVVTL